jgi:hypothetical protein
MILALCYISTSGNLCIFLWQRFSGKSKELRGRWVGISEHIGNKITYKIITDDTGEEVCRSAIRSALDPTMKNLCED